jgi:hypothetical protein
MGRNLYGSALNLVQVQKDYRGEELTANSLGVFCQEKWLIQLQLRGLIRQTNR